MSLDTEYTNLRLAGWFRTNSYNVFNHLHSWCNGQMESISDVESTCDECGATECEGTFFNSEANPQYDNDGHKTGSGEWQTIEYEAYIPIYAVKEVV